MIATSRTRRRALVLPLLLLVLAAPAARAVDNPSELLPDARQEARAEAIGRQLRCLVCQNEDIEDSGADLARDLRHAVRMQVSSGRSDHEIMGWMTARYGSFVRLSPPVSAATWLLWSMPVLALAAGAAVAWRSTRAAARTAPPPLDPEERARLASLIGRG